MSLVAVSVVGTFVWDRLVTALFAPAIFSAMLSEARQTSAADLLPVLRSAAKVGVVVGLIYMGSKNQEPIV